MPARATLGLFGAGAMAAWLALVAADRRRIAADPLREHLQADLAGHPFPVTGFDGTRLHAEEFGPPDAPAVVLVHGWMCSLRFWTRQVQDLARDHRVVAYDLRGHGRSERSRRGDYRIDVHAADLGEVLRSSVPAGKPATLVAHSMGAMSLVALSANESRTFADHVGAAVLVNTGMGDLVPSVLAAEGAGFRHRALTAWQRAVIRSSLPWPRVSTPLSHRIVRQVALHPEASPAEVAFCEALFVACRTDVRSGCGKSFEELDLHQALERFRVPTTVIAGARDRITPPALSARIVEELPDLHGDPLFAANAGHMMPVTHPDEVNARIRALTRLEAAS